MLFVKGLFIAKCNLEFRHPRNSILIFILKFGVNSNSISPTQRRKNFLIPYLIIDGLRCIITGAYIPMLIHTVIVTERKYRKGPMQIMWGTILFFGE